MPLQSDPDQTRCGARTAGAYQCMLYKGHHHDHKSADGAIWANDQTTHDPVDMTKITIWDDISNRLTEASNLIFDALTGVKEADDQASADSGNRATSYKVTAEYMRAQTYAQIATAQAIHVCALELGMIGETLRTLALRSDLTKRKD